MPEYTDAYNEALHRAREAFRGPDGLAARTLRAVYDEFAALLVRIRDSGTDEILTADRAEALSSQIRQHMATLSVRLERTLAGGARDAAGLATAGHRNALQAASEAAGVAVSHSFDAVPERALENMFVRRGLDIPGGGLSGTFETLFRRRIRGVAGEMDDVLTSAVAEGKSAGRLTREIAATMARDDPMLAQALEARGTSASALHRGVSQVEDAEFRKLLYDARRISVSEVNNAYNEGFHEAAQESPVVSLLRWTTSGRHEGLHSYPDVCTYYASADHEGFGPGLFHKATCPSLPHPHCACSQQAVLRRPSEWNDPQPSIPNNPGTADEGSVRAVLEANATERSRTITDAFVRNQTEMANTKIEAAYSVAAEADEATFASI